MVSPVAPLRARARSDSRDEDPTSTSLGADLIASAGDGSSSTSSSTSTTTSSGSSASASAGLKRDLDWQRGAKAGMKRRRVSVRTAHTMNDSDGDDYEHSGSFWY